MLSRYLFLLVCLFAEQGHSEAGIFAPVDLRVRGENNFVGDLRPDFRWALACDGCSGVLLSSFRLRIWDVASDLEVWDTGYVASHTSRYRTSELMHFLRGDASYAWTLTVRGSAMGAPNMSGEATATFRTALLRAEDWRGAMWIGGGTAYRTEFRLPATKPSVSAVAYVSGVGCVEVTVNGQKVVDAFMEPSWANIPRVRMYYRAYDVQRFLGAGVNALGLRTGMCKYGYLGDQCEQAAGGSTAACRAVILRLSVQFVDGTSQDVTTRIGDDWLATTTGDPVTYSHLYHGEIYDARLESAWDQPGFRASSDWRPSRAYTDASHFGTLTLAQQPAIAISESHAPVSIKTPAPAVYVFDFGQNMAGFATLRAQSLARGTHITLKYAEVLLPSGRVNMAFCSGEGSDCVCGDHQANCANQTDMYIARGGEEEVFTPHFTYHGYRYVQMEGLPREYVVGAGLLTAHFVHSNVSTSGHVHFANPAVEILNQIQTAIRYTQLSNLHHHPTDCPQREKRGWMGDAQITSAEASLNFDTTALYEHWLQTFADSQLIGCRSTDTSSVSPETSPWYNCCNPNVHFFGCNFHGVADDFNDSTGSLPDVTPYFKLYGGWPGDPSWGAAGVVLPRELSVQRGEIVTPELYNVAKRLVDFFNGHGDPNAGGVLSFGYYGDWLGLDTPPVAQVTGWSHLLCVSHFVELARASGHDEDAASYGSVLSKLKAAYHAHYWNATTRSYGTTQTANLLPLFLDIPPPDVRPDAQAAFVASLNEANNMTTAGIIGAAYMLQTLSKIGRGDIALEMATATREPSWGHMILQGPGTIWESWDDSTNSHNHPALAASVGPYLFELAGVLRESWNEGFVFELDPVTARIVKSASVHVGSASGQFSFTWALSAQDFTLSARIPHGEKAELRLLAPGESSLCHNLYAQGSAVWSDCPNGFGARVATVGVQWVSAGAHGPVLSVGSGSHHFELRPVHGPWSLLYQ
mmetsp:Transcript_19634/g.52347  ORF Transcript_19634/g.52347 Transcript_19634/m.52347 type:complete len:977 (-) Transcript_19634:139-3069(-)